MSKQKEATRKIYYLCGGSNGPSPEQISVIGLLHGDVEVVSDPVVFKNIGNDNIQNYVLNHDDGFVYVVTSGNIATLWAFTRLVSLHYGIMELNYFKKRQDGSPSLVAVYHANDYSLNQVWVDPNL